MANVLAFGEAFGDDPKASIPNDILEERLGVLVDEKMKLLKDKAYFHKVVEYMKDNNLIAETAKKLKKTIPISPFMRDVSNSISEGYITFTDIGIASGDYAFILKIEFTLANFIADKKISDGENIDLQKTVGDLFKSFSNNSDLFQEQKDFLIESEQLDVFKKFSVVLLDGTLRECLKNYKIDDVIKGMVDGGFGEFAVVGG